MNLPMPEGDSGFLRRYRYVLRGQRRPLLLMLGLFLTMSLFDIVGVGLIGPFLGIMIDPALAERVAPLRAALNWIGVAPGSREAVLALGLLLVGLFLTKGVLALAVQHRIFRFSFYFRAQLLARLTDAYLRMPYQFFLDRNSSAVVQAVIDHTKVTVDDLVLPSLRMVSDCMTLSMLFVFLCWVSPLAMLTLALMLLLATGLYIRVIRPVVKAAGQQVAAANEQVIRGVNEAVGGIKEIKVLRIEPGLVASIASAAGNTAGAQTRFYTMLSVPRSLMEVVLIVFVVGFSVGSVLAGADGKVLIPVLATFGVASLRLLPSVISASSAFASMNFAAHSLYSLYQDLRDAEQAPQAAPANSGAAVAAFASLSLVGVTYAYRSAQRNAIENITLNIRQGQSVGLIGESGAGKSTLVDVLLGLHPFDAGRLAINGVDIDQFGWQRWLDQVAYIPQSPFMTDDTLERNIAFGVAAGQIDAGRLHSALKAAQLEGLVARLPHGIVTVLGERGVRLSGGERQRIALARAFYHDRNVFIFDEATSALDSETERQVIDVIDSLHGIKTLIVIAHRLGTVQRCDQICRMQAGRIIAAGTYEEVIGGKDAAKAAA